MIEPIKRILTQWKAVFPAFIIVTHVVWAAPSWPDDLSVYSRSEWEDDDFLLASDSDYQSGVADDDWDLDFFDQLDTDLGAEESFFSSEDDQDPLSFDAYSGYSLYDDDREPNPFDTMDLGFNSPFDEDEKKEEPLAAQDPLFEEELSALENLEEQLPKIEPLSAPAKDLAPAFSHPTPELPPFQQNSTAQADPPPQPTSNVITPPATKPPPEEERPDQQKILIKFDNVGVIEFIRFLSKISGKNFIFDEEELQFNVTLISDEPTTIENILVALLQELRIHGLTMMEQGNNIIIHRNTGVNSISKIVARGLPEGEKSEIVTQVFQLNTLDPNSIAGIVRPLASDSAVIEVLPETNHFIVTDLATNVEQIGKLIKSLDSPISGLVVGQYVIHNAFIDTILEMAREIMLPIAQNQTLIFVPHRVTNSIFIVSTPFLVERTISILQHLDQTQGTTRIYDLDGLQVDDEVYQFSQRRAGEAPTDEYREMGDLTPEAQSRAGGAPIGDWGRGIPGAWHLDKQGNWTFDTGDRGTVPPEGKWLMDPQGNWFFQEEGKPTFKLGRSVEGEEPKGVWKLNPDKVWVYQLYPDEQIKVQGVRRTARTSDLPRGHVDRTRFHIEKLQYRRGEEIVDALERIGSSLSDSTDRNDELISSIYSIQWIESSNSIVFTGNDETIPKILKLINELDVPLRQVFIEMLVIETDIDDSLEYGVNWGSRFAGPDGAGAQAFLSLAEPLTSALDTSSLGQSPDASSIAQSQGYNLGIIGRTLSRDGTEFATIGALVKALHQKTKTDIIMNPKILTEDNNPAEIFVGINTRFQTQSLANDQGEIITTNFEFRDVGTTLRVTPLLGNTDIITLEIEQEVSSVLGGQGGNTGGGGGNSSLQTTDPGPTTRISKTTTRVHVPNKYFLVISGMIQDQVVNSRFNVPCLGGAPVIGALFSSKNDRIEKRNLMIFIRPQIVDTYEEMQTLTKQQQDILHNKNKTKKMWKYEVEEGLDWMNFCTPQCGVQERYDFQEY